jgi:dolichyl-diphosphooligosaccharide--protein glycosyltransferase
MTIGGIGFAGIFVFLTLSGSTKFSGRSMTLLDPTYAKRYVPIIASVSEHQPTTWSSYFFDLGYLIVFMPIGFYYCLVHKCTLGKLFIAMYGVLATYFSCVMIRLMLVLAPVACILAAIAISELMRKASKSIRIWMTDGFEESEAAVGDGEDKPKKDKIKKTLKKSRLPVDSAAMIIMFLILTL